MLRVHKLRLELDADSVLHCVLITDTQAQAMEALQIGFLLVENENQQFLIDVCAALPQTTTPPPKESKGPLILLPRH